MASTSIRQHHPARTISSSSITQQRHSSPAASPTPKRSPLPPTASTSRQREHQSRSHRSDTEVGAGRDHMAEPQHPVSPTPKKGGRQRRDGSRRPRAKRAELVGTDGTEGEGSGALSGDEDSLFDLLGIAPPPAEDGPSRETKGILAVSKADIEGGSGTRREKQPRGGRRTKMDIMQSEPERFPVLGQNGKLVGEERDPQSEGEVKRKRQPKRGKGKTNDPAKGTDTDNASGQPVSALTASRPRSAKQKRPVVPAVGSGNDDDAFETASLSQSLPSGGLFTAAATNGDAANGKAKSKGRRKGKAAPGSGAEGDESAVWEMPEIPGPTANQSMTWQQKLQSSTNPTDSPRRANKSSSPHSNPSGPSNGAPNQPGPERKARTRGTTANTQLPNAPSAMPASPLHARPVQTRRLSLDNLPISAFDQTQPFHTGFNVHRAPQTPAKLPGNMTPSHTLPTIQGDFPRIAKGSKNPAALPLHFQQQPQQPQQIPQPFSTPGVKGFKYAGPTFHNSPHAASLPKPDLDDF